MFWAAAVLSLYLIGIYWCYEVIRRLPGDVREIFQLREIGRTLAIIFVWIITVPLAFGVITYGFVLVRRLVWFFSTL